MLWRQSNRQPQNIKLGWVPKTTSAVYFLSEVPLTSVGNLIHKNLASNELMRIELPLEKNLSIYCEWQTVDSCVSQKRENLRFSVRLSLLRSFSIYLGNRQERSLNESSFFVFWQKEKVVLPFAVCRKRHAWPLSCTIVNGSFEDWSIWYHNFLFLKLSFLKLVTNCNSFDRKFSVMGTVDLTSTRKFFN